MCIGAASSQALRPRLDSGANSAGSHGRARTRSEGRGSTTGVRGVRAVRAQEPGGVLVRWEESCGVEDEDTDLSRDIPGTLQNPYIVYDHGFPTAQLNTPQVNPPPNQPLLVTPFGRPLGTISATHSAAMACSDAAATRAPPGAS